jgi:hypothetical protein
MKNKMKDFYMNIAVECSKMSKAIRLQVGAIIVKDDNILSFSWNGTPAGWDNNCENKEWCSAGGWLDPEEIEEQWPYEGTYLDANGNEVMLETTEDLWNLVQFIEKCLVLDPQDRLTP